MSDTININGASKPLDYIPGTKKSPPHYASLPPTSKPLLRRIFDRPVTRSRPSYVRPVLGQGPSHSRKHISKYRPKPKPKPQLKLPIDNEKFSPARPAPRPKMNAHFAKSGPTVQTQATDAMGAATEMRRMMLERAREEDRRRSRVDTSAPQQSVHHSPVVSPFVPEITPKDRTRTRDQADKRTRRHSHDSDSIVRMTRPSNDGPRRERERSRRHHQPSIYVNREPHEYLTHQPELFAEQPIEETIPAPAQQHHHLPGQVRHLFPHHQTAATVPQNNAVIDHPTTRTVHTTRDRDHSRSKSGHCFTSFFQAIADLFLTLGHLCGIVASSILTVILGIVHVILTSLLLIVGFFVDTFTTLLRIFFNIITCHFSTGNYRWETPAFRRAWEWGRESQWVWSFIQHVTGPYDDHDQANGHHEGNRDGIEGKGRQRSVVIDLEKGLAQGATPVPAQPPRVHRTAGPNFPREQISY